MRRPGPSKPSTTTTPTEGMSPIRVFSQPVMARRMTRHGRCQREFVIPGDQSASLVEEVEGALHDLAARAVLGVEDRGPPAPASSAPAVVLWVRKWAPMAREERIFSAGSRLGPVLSGPGREPWIRRWLISAGNIAESPP